MKVFAYLRVSSKGQVDGDGFERQNEKITQFCAEHKLTIMRSVWEEGVSGTTECLLRPEFSNMVRHIDNIAETNPTALIEAIIVERMDRLARDLMVSEVLLAECRKRNIKVFAADQGTLEDMASNSGDPTRVLIRQLMGAIAQWEKSVLVAKMRSARERIRERDGRCEGQKPFGSTPDEAVTVLMIKNRFRTNDGLQLNPYTDITEYLNENGRPMRNGNKWNWRAVRRMCERLNTKGLI